MAEEVVAIARALAVAPTRFARLEVTNEGSADAIAIAPGGGDRRRIVLRRRPDGAGRTRCVFLLTAGSGRAICGLGELAPEACRAFPAPATEGRVEGCWRRWQAHEIEAPAAVVDRGAGAIARWNAIVAGRPYPLDEDTFFDALLADAAMGTREGGDSTLPEPSSRSGCATCTTSRCCVVFDPELTGADLHRLVSGLGLEARDVAELRPVRVDQAGPDAIHLGDERAWDLRLRRTGALGGHQGPGGRRRCGFLTDLSRADRPELAPASRCGVYAQRPAVCRLFPSDLTAFGVMVGNPEGVCPPGAWAQERSDLRTLEALHHVALEERTRFRAFLAGWNASSGALAGRPHDERVAAFMEAALEVERRAAEQRASKVTIKLRSSGA